MRPGARLAVVAALTIAGPLMAAIAAQAAPYNCNSGKWWSLERRDVIYPVFVSGAAWTANCGMVQGNYNNWAVVVLQNALIKCYGQGIARDGDFGPATAAALYNAERWERVVHGRQVVDDGVYDHETFFVLRWPTTVPGAGIDSPHTCVA